MNQGKRSTASESETPVEERAGEQAGAAADDTASAPERPIEAEAAPEQTAEAEEPVEAAESDAETPAAEDELVILQGQLEEATAKADENWNQFLRARADLENVQRRAERDVANAHKFGIEKFAKDLLPVRDSLEMGIAAAAEDGADPAKLLEGSELTLKMLTTALDKHGLKVVDPKGEKFNPEQHEAMAMQPSTEAEPNTVLQVIQKGYLLNERVLRPAMVIVAKAE